MQARKIILPVLMVLFTTSFAFCQTEMLKGVVNNLAYYKQKNELKYLDNAKKSIDSLIKVSPDSADLEQHVYSVVVNSCILYIDSLNKLKQPADFFRKTITLVDELGKRKKIYKYQPEMDFAKQCLANVYIRKAFAYISNYDYANARQLFLRAYSYAPAFRPLNAYIAFTNNKMGNLEVAAKYYDNLIKADSTKTMYVETASNIYKSIGDTAKAIEIVKRARKVLPDDPFLLLDEANIYSNKRNYSALASLLPKLLDINVNNPDIVFAAANCYDHLYQYDKAETLYLRAIDINNSAYDPIFDLGLLYLKKSELKSRSDKEKNISYAEQWVEKANEISPNNINCLKVLQLIYSQTGNINQLNNINNKLKQLTNQ
jgi:tetratricopeptide (TPR) repeat protein